MMMETLCDHNNKLIKLKIEHLKHYICNLDAQHHAAKA